MYRVQCTYYTAYSSQCTVLCTLVRSTTMAKLFKCVCLYFLWGGGYILCMFIKKNFNKQNCFYFYVKFVGIFSNKFKYLYTTRLEIRTLCHLLWQSRFNCWQWTVSETNQCAQCKVHPHYLHHRHQEHCHHCHCCLHQYIHHLHTRHQHFCHYSHCNLLPDREHHTDITHCILYRSDTMELYCTITIQKVWSKTWFIFVSNCSVNMSFIYWDRNAESKIISISAGGIGMDLLSVFLSQYSY